MKNKRLNILGSIFMIFITLMAIIGVMDAKNLFINNSSDDVLSLKEVNEVSKLDYLAGSQTITLAYGNNNKYTSSTDLLNLYFSRATNSNLFKITDSKGNSGSLSTYKGVFNKSSKTAVVSLPDGVYGISYYDATIGQYATANVTISGACKDEVKLNQTGTFKVERCLIKDSKGNITARSSGDIATCADGYTWKSKEAEIVTDTCKDATLGGLSRRYCKRIFQATCVKETTSKPPTTTKPVAAATLSSLSVSSGTLSPAFKSSTKSYSVTVGSNVSSIKINATAASGSSFVGGSGPRTVNLNYGTNSIKIKVKNSAGKQTTYTIKVTRPDGRSSVNTLSNLKVGAGTLTPAFSPTITNYTVDVDNNVDYISVDATLTDNKSSFATGFGPNTHNLELGPNKIYVKVVSEKGETNVYNITVNRATLPSKCTTETESLALLKQIDLSVDLTDLQIDQIEDFDPRQFTYNNIKVPYKVTNLTVNGYVETEGDTVVVEGADDLEVGETREIKITVTSKECSNYSNVYTLNVQRQPEVTLGDNAELKDITIANHDDFKFEPNVLKYNLILNRDEDKLDISYEKELDSTQCDITGNEDLGYSSEVVIRCVSEDGEDIVEYTITIDGVEKGTNIFFIIILVIIIILILIYLVLRLLGYRIYFNFGSLFRGMNEKVKNVFDN